jgi:hypothetical protein
MKMIPHISSLGMNCFRKRSTSSFSLISFMLQIYDKVLKL